MRKAIVICLAASLWLMLEPFGRAEAHVDVHIGVGVPAPPTVIFDREPEVVLVPQTNVYYVPGQPDYDVYRYGGYWYVNRDGYWYRSQSYQGPFTYIVYDRVPRPIVVLPGEYHHHPFRPRSVSNHPPGHVHTGRAQGGPPAHWRHASHGHPDHDHADHDHGHEH